MESIKRTAKFPELHHLDKELDGIIKQVNERFNSQTFDQWDDIQVPVRPEQINPATSKPDFDYDNLGFLFDDSSTETIHLTIQFPHSWEQGTDIRPHLYWVQSGTGSVLWKMEYKWYNNGERVPSTYIDLGNSDKKVFPYQSGDLLQITDLPRISGTGKRISSFMDIQISRIGASDTYVGDVLLKELDIHILKNSTGSEREFIKDGKIYR